VLWNNRLARTIKFTAGADEIHIIQHARQQPCDRARADHRRPWNRAA